MRTIELETGDVLFVDVDCQLAAQRAAVADQVTARSAPQVFRGDEKRFDMRALEYQEGDRALSGPIAQHPRVLELEVQTAHGGREDPQVVLGEEGVRSADRSPPDIEQELAFRRQGSSNRVLI